MRTLVFSIVAFMSICLSNGQNHTYTANDVARALSDADRFEEEGKYEKSLERHIWYHRNALKYAPGQSGVRLSFALSHWVRLGEKYPKALVALRQLRDETLNNFRKTSADARLFGEVMSIDGYLGDWSHMKKIFYEGRRHQIDDPALILRLEDILAIPDRAWARDILGTPMARIEQIKQERNLRATMLRGNGIKDKVGPMLDETEAYEMVKVIEAVNQVFGRTEALRVQKAALKILDRPEIRSALG